MEKNDKFKLTLISLNNTLGKKLGTRINKAWSHKISFYVSLGNIESQNFKWLKDDSRSHEWKMENWLS